MCGKPVRRGDEAPRACPRAGHARGQGHSARMVSMVTCWPPPAAAALLQVTLTVIRERRFGAGVAPACTTVHARVTPASGVSLPLLAGNVASTQVAPLL